MKIVMKISGESLKENDNLSDTMLERIYQDVKKLVSDKHQLLLIVGGGNFWRGRNKIKINQSTSDQIGMLATAMNRLALSDYLNNKKITTTIYSAFNIEGLAEKYNYHKVINDLNNKKVVVLVGGLGVPNFSTDMNTVEKAIEFNADMIIMAKNVEAIYDKDPREKDARKYSIITHEELFLNQIKNGLTTQGVMDLEAMAALCKYKIPLYLYCAKNERAVIDFNKENSGTKVISK